MIKVEPVSQSVTLVRFDHGRVSALDLEFLVAVRAELAALAETDAALVLTGTGSAFSAGVDLVRLVEGGPDYVADFIPTLAGLFADLFSYQRPVVAAVNGHAVAGGCVIACCADHRLMADGRGRIGVPELLVGVPFPAVALMAVRSAVGEVGAADLVYSGATLLPDEALRRGLVDEVVPEAELMERAVAKAERLAAIPAPTFLHTKHSLRDRYWSELDATGRIRDAEMLELWKSPVVHSAVSDYVKKTLGK